MYFKMYSLLCLLPQAQVVEEAENTNLVILFILLGSRTLNVFQWFPWLLLFCNAARQYRYIAENISQKGDIDIF